jgi:uncharacterized membrane protein
MRKLLYAIVVGLIGAGIAHIVILFLLPQMSPRDAWSRLAESTDLYATTPYQVASPVGGQAGVADPYFRAVACRFDLSDGVTRIFRDGKVPFWSASVYDRNGQNIYSLSDRTANDGVLDIVVLTPAQMVDMRKSPLEELQDSVFVEAPITEGMVVIRSFVPDESWNSIITGFLGAIDCSAQPI